MSIKQTILLFISVYLFIFIVGGIGYYYTHPTGSAALSQNPALVVLSHKEYQQHPPIKPALPKKEPSGKIAYLTFDDGPDRYVTPLVLDTLKKENIKATFFVTGEAASANKDLLAKNYLAGNSIGNHTYSHNYRLLYKKPQSFWNDFKRAEDIIYQDIGIRPHIFRCPYGSYPGFTAPFRQMMGGKGYVFFDWDIDSTDSNRRNMSVSSIRTATLTQINRLDKQDARLVILFHDGGGHKNSALALPDVIHDLKKRGYAFGVLTPDVKPVQFKAKT
ncbi:polysaccharide deacetylase family protein [Aneurinibacillus terranovensis]|uniref:polysaccharide deacetylase family protein n=1 Tax=Aneurinibacillus terranovensis TaxID=278991 RepID=UPI000416C347|nr:polysaccharide deacetylase family protein [Aneurinibacillus terranovensis]